MVTFCIVSLIAAGTGDAGCYSIVAGRKATADGSVLFAHNEDNGLSDVAGLRRIPRRKHEPGTKVMLPGGGRLPQVPETFAFWYLQMPECEYSDALLNEFGVAVASNNCPSREQNPAFTDGGIGGPVLRRLVAERARTARQGVELVGSLVSRFGYTASGRTLSIADPTEGWLVAMVCGKHWVAARVPDDQVALIANTYTIGSVNLEDPRSFRGSPDLISYAIHRGWYDPATGPFSFERAYANRAARRNPANTHRQYSGLNRLAAAPPPPPEDGRLPFAVTPKVPLTVRHITQVLRDHYEGVWYKHEPNTAAPSPHRGHTTTICRPETNSSSVFQLRSSMPVPIGAVWWLCLWQPCSNPYVPLYAGMDTVPNELELGAPPRPASPATFGPAYTVFSEEARWVEADYAVRCSRVRARWKAFEKKCFDAQPRIERRALARWKKAPALARQIVTQHSHNAVAHAVREARSILSSAWRRHTIDASSRGADGVRLKDVNSDGLLDIATGWEEGGVIRAYLNPGPARSAEPWPAVTVGSVRSPEDAVFVDLDADGAVDVVSACEGSVRTIWIHWAPRQKDRYLHAGAWTTEALPQSRSRGAWMFCLPLQVDGKNGIDLVAGAKGRNAQIGWFEAPGAARDLAAWTWHPLYDAGWIMSLVASDIDGDGDQDILASDRKGPSRGVLWLENPGTGPAQTHPWPVHRVGGATKQVMFLSIVDLDRDGLKDVLTAVSGTELLYSRRTRAGFPSWENYTIRLPAGAGKGKAVAAGDIDLDGRPDIVFTCEHAKDLSGVMWLSAPGRVTDPAWISHDISGSRAGVKYDLAELLDLDGDGDLDVLTCEEANNLGVIWYENPQIGSPGRTDVTTGGGALPE